MIKEIIAAAAKEAAVPSVEKFSEIKSQYGMKLSEAKKFWDKKFHGEPTKNNNPELGEKSTIEKNRIDQTPKEGERGHWEGERGNSKFKPSEETEAGKACVEKLAEYGEDGIEYKNGEPDFSEVSEGTVQIDNMTDNRNGNFSQADKKLAEEWNSQKREGKTDWKEEDVYNYRKENKLSWHERCDTKTMDLVSQDVHSYCGHSGGVSECKAKLGQSKGGGFDV